MIDRGRGGSQENDVVMYVWYYLSNTKAVRVTRGRKEQEVRVKRTTHFVRDLGEHEPIRMNKDVRTEFVVKTFLSEETGI